MKMVENGEISSVESKATSSFSNFFKNVIHYLISKQSNIQIRTTV